MVAVWLPADVGLNLTVNVMESRLARVFGKVAPVTENIAASVPVKVMAPLFNWMGLLPVLWMVKVFWMFTTRQLPPKLVLLFVDMVVLPSAMAMPLPFNWMSPATPINSVEPLRSSSMNTSCSLSLLKSSISMFLVRIRSSSNWRALVNSAEPVPKKTYASLEFVAATSGFPSPLKSATVIEIISLVTD